MFLNILENIREEHYRVKYFEAIDLAINSIQYRFDQSSLHHLSKS